ncbi:replicative DNA helicase [Actinocatenispora rupis]|uniref:Replicative DNA helicase n=1 Tax=Actinocatenispora rupis TaxID=519421 RepID=A0A8J3NDT6_9ACTN|nr:replicative DNA helicase [Actinocatenispora rupis]GID13297.1 hypothetical protein Aru02nite_41860 [Actinocatenispora rupis]
MSISEEVRPPGGPDEDEPGRSRPPGGGRNSGGAGGPGGDFERTPPQDVAAEQCVLGGMLLSKDAIADVVEILKTNDFYQPKHGIVFDAILDLYGRGEPADVVTVAAALIDSGDINKVGGAPYLHTLAATVPTAANAAYYARIVADRAVLRRLIEAGTRVTQLGYGAANGAGRDIDDIVDMAQQAVYDVTERRVSEDFAALNELLQPTLDEIEAIGAAGGVMTGVPTGFTDLDRLLNGLHAGQLVIVAGRPGLGKALALDTPLPTPTGWTTMGEVRPGDRLIGADGRPTRVVAATDVMHDRPCYEVEFSDGTVIVADAQHEWRTSTRASRRQQSETRTRRYWADGSADRLRATYAAVCAGPDRAVTMPDEAGAEVRHVLHTVGKAVGATGTVPREYVRRGQPWTRQIPTYSRQALLGALVDPALRPVNAATTAVHRPIVTTEQIAATVRCPDGRPNHAVDVAGPADLPDRDLPIPAYTLGAWLGDGHSAGPRITTADAEIVTGIERDGFRMVPGAGPMVYAVTWADPTGRPALTTVLRDLGVLDDKHIPTGYLRASERQRRALLAGLLDTDGYAMPDGTVQFAVTNRRLAMDTRELILSLGYQVSLTTTRVKGRTDGSSTCHVLTFTPADPVFRLSRKRSRQVTTGRVTTRPRYVVAVRPVPSVPVRCVQVDSVDHMYLASESWIPTHNSTVAMDFARACSIKNNMASVIFSLEMSKVEIVMRLLSAEARVPLHTLRSGQLSDDDWTKLARRMGEISEAPLFCDDTPNMTLMEVRAKARRLKQRHDIKLIVVDYLQLMSGPKKAESRQQEVAELSRGLKLLAKEIHCPVIAACQLNRGPEQRTDKRPQLSDLRESGCLTADTRILRADTGAEISLGELLASGSTDVPVWSVDEKLRYHARTLTHAFPSGVREVFRLTLASGRTVEATANHPFLTFDGWRPLGELSAGSRLAVPRHVPAPLVTTEWPDDEVVMLAHLIGDGSFVRRQPIRYASVDEENLTAVTRAARHFGITAVRDDHATSRCTSLRLPAPFPLARGRRNPIAQWLDGLGLFGLRSHEKFVPDGVFSLPKRQIALFVRHLWATDGCAWWDERNDQARIYYASTSRRLVDQLALLLLRFGIQTHIKAVRKAGYRDGYQLVISGGDDQLRFLREIGVHGARAAGAAQCRVGVESRKRNTNRDTVPREVWTRVRSTLAERGMSHREFAKSMGTQFCGSTLWKHAPSRGRLAKVAAVLDDADLEILATNDMYWDEVVSIVPLGEKPVYDATVLGTHNFVANGIAVHNSIEQDADVVLLLHRDDYYDKESPRAGEADFIVAKHRNGPTDTVTVAAQLHLSRFVDMAVD